MSKGKHSLKVFYVVFVLLPGTDPLSSQTKETDSYKLYKDGKRYPKPIVYLLADKKDVLYKEGAGLTIFTIKKQHFRHVADTHEYRVLPKTEFEDFRLTDAVKLIEVEHLEFSKRAREIEIEEGFKPMPPIRHGILKVFVFLPKKGEYELFEVDWELSRF